MPLVATGTGKGRICGELKKLGISVSPSMISRILIENGFDPAPQRRDGAWFEFVDRQFKTLWACDFFSTKVWTPRSDPVQPGGEL